jgi:(p)ppGpp synthase/HD superfamily hydrolase
MNLNEAIILATAAHRNQTRKGSNDLYILHPLRVMLQCKTETARIAAVLHDVLEDTDLSVESMYAVGIPSEAVSIVEALTRKESEPYGEYITRIKNHSQTAIDIKILDIQDNLAEGNHPNHKSLKKRYFKALNRLLAKEPQS